MIKKIGAIMAAASLAAIMSFSAAAAGWISPDGVNWQYQMDMGNVVKNMLMPLDGSYYGFDPAGNKMLGWGQLNGNWYYFDPAANGAMLTGWFVSPQDGYTYYLDPGTGIMQTGFANIDGKRYYFLSNGQMFRSSGAAGTILVNGYYYMTNNDGSIIVNETKSQDSKSIKWDEEGRMFYRSSMTKVVQDSNEWTVWTPDIDNNFDYDTFNDMVNFKMSELYEKYQNVWKSYEKRINWETSVQNILQQMGLPENAVSQFISDVKSGRYDDVDPVEYYQNPNGSYDSEAEYDPNNDSYYGSYDDDYDYDYDYDWDW